MYKFFIVLLALSLAQAADAQVIPHNGNNCIFLKNLKFKNGTDTIVVKATYISIDECLFTGPIFKTLQKEGKIKRNKNSDSQITFRPINCEKEYIAPESGINYQNALKNSNIGKQLYFTCVVFERKDWYNNSTPFFIIIKSELKNH